MLKRNAYRHLLKKAPLDWMVCGVCGTETFETEWLNTGCSKALCKEETAKKDGKKIDSFLKLITTEEWLMSNLPATCGMLQREQVANLMLAKEASSIDLDLHYLMSMKANMPNVPTADFVNFVHKAQKFGADPVKNQVYLIPFEKSKKVNGVWLKKTEGSTIFAYDFFISRAKADDNFDGWEQKTSVDEYFDPVKCEAKKTLKCVTTVHLKNSKFPVVYTAWYPEFVKLKNDGAPTKAWTKANLMLEKCSLCNGLRQAFPASLSGMRSDYDTTTAEDKTEDKKEDLSQSPGEIVEGEIVDASYTVVDEVKGEEPHSTPPNDNTDEKVKKSNPTASPESTHPLAEYICEAGKFQGQKLGKLEPSQIASYVDFIRDADTKAGKPILDTVVRMEDYLISISYSG